MKQLLFLIVLSFLVHVYSLPANGIFTVNCSPLSVQRSDPIVNPGVPGGHVHSIIGGNAFKRTMGPMDAQNATQTTCDKMIDHSNYWVPQLYHQRPDKMWELVPFVHSAVYYLLRACDYAPNLKNCDNAPVPLAFPYGFRMVSGDPLRRTYNESDKAERAVSLVCLGGAGGRFNGLPPHHCDEIRAQVFFPSCWDGKNLDSPDHKSHVAYPAIGDYNGGVCPESHPVALFSIFFEFFFDTKNVTDTKFAFANGDPTGYGYHGDFVMGWTNRDLLQTAHKDCVGPSDCPKLGNQPYQTRPLIYPAMFEEEIGLHGPIPALPGNNPVTWPNLFGGAIVGGHHH